MDPEKLDSGKGPEVLEQQQVSVGEIINEDLRYGHTKRGLKSRHVQLMAIGGSIGTGLFVGIGASLSRAGPLSVFLAYLIYSCIFIWPTNMAVAELVAFLPLRRGIFEFGIRFLDPAIGFAFGWAYFYAAAMLVCTEFASVATVMGYWDTTTNAGVWIAMALVVCLILNIYAVKWYGESEFIFSSIKALLIIGLCILTFITMVGGNPRHDAYGFRYWKHGNAMHEYYSTGTLGRFLGWWSCMRYAAFSVGGPDMIALSAGEIINPRRTIPRMARLVFYRVCGFYILGVLAVGIICSSRDNRLLGALNAGSVGSAASPWVIGISNLHINGLAGFINFLILTSGWSCGNAYMYTSSRTLYSLALEGQAPKFLRKCTKSGIPIYCVLIVALISCVTFMVASTASATVFDWFVGLSTCATIIVYSMMMVIWVGFDRSLKAQGISRDSLPWKAPLMPYAAYIGIAIGILLLIFLGFDVFVPWDTQGFITTYFGIAYVFALYLFWKFYKKTKFVDFKQVDIFAGKAEIDEECKIWEEAPANAPVSGNFIQRAWERI